MRLEGMTFAEIGAVLGISKQSVQESFEKAMAIDPEDTKHAREEALKRLNMMYAEASEAAEKRGADRARFLDVKVKIENRRAKLLGLDAPTRTEVTGGDGAPLLAEMEGAVDKLRAALAAKLVEKGVGTTEASGDAPAPAPGPSVDSPTG